MSRLEQNLPLPALSQLLGGRPKEVVLLGGGRNSRVYQVLDPGGRVYALKQYFHHPADPRDRMGVEFRALHLLWGQGLRCIPQPLKADPGAHLALLEFIPGGKVLHPTLAHMKEACDFLVQLLHLSRAPGLDSLPTASEAHFSIREIIEHIQVRLDWQIALLEKPEVHPGLRTFLLEQLQPAWLAIIADCRDQCRSSGTPFEVDLAWSKRTLSPSDFGFHNAIQREGRLVFLDFEYFGWDDPAKLLADFLLHPGMNLSVECRQDFARAMLAGFEHLPELWMRTKLVLPLFGIKWCLILLNEFLEGPLVRRAFADPIGIPARERQEGQLEKARRKLQQVLDEQGHFPYSS